MAATVSILGTVTFNTTSGSKSVTATPAVGDLIIIITANSGSTTTTAAPTDNNAGGGGTYTLINTAVKNASADTMQMWVRNALITSATSTTFTQAPGTTTGGGLLVLDVQGMGTAGSGAIARSGVQSNQAAATTPAPNLGAVPRLQNAIIGAVFNGSNAAGLSPRTGYTEIVDIGYNTPATGLEAMYRNSGETSATITWLNASATAFGSIAVELDTRLTHATTGSLTGPGSTIAGSANHLLLHTTSGDLSGPGAAIVGTATTFTAHSTSGDLPGQTATITGAADREPLVVPHVASGDIVGPGSTINGSATRFREFATSGDLPGQTATVVGAADHEALIIPHVASGDIVGPGSTVAGAAARFRQFDTAGALPGQEASINGVSLRYRAFDSTGDLQGSGATVTGDADHEGLFTEHIAAGDIYGPGPVIFGQAEKTHYFDASGDIVGPGAQVAGQAEIALLYPDPADVRAGVHYGPGGMYVGTLTVGAGETIIRLRSFTERF